MVTPPARRSDEKVVSIKYESTDGTTTTSRSKGKQYVPVDSDGRTGRLQHMKSMGNINLASNTVRNTFKGLSDMRGLVKVPFEEGVEHETSNYDKSDEKLILESNKRIKDLISELEKKDAVKKQAKAQ